MLVLGAQLDTQGACMRVLLCLCWQANMLGALHQRLTMHQGPTR